VISVVPDDNFRHWTLQHGRPACPQLGIIDIRGDLYFGAVGHIEQAIHRHGTLHPRQRFLLLRMHGVHHCDISGIQGLESIVRSYRERGGDVFMVRVDEAVMRVMRATGFHFLLGADHFLPEDNAIEHLFYKVLDPAICIYESDVRVFRECQNLPRPDYPIEIPLHTATSTGKVPEVAPRVLWNELRGATPPVVVDVREPREFKTGHIPGARLLPFTKLLTEKASLPDLRTVVLVCRGGRRSARACAMLRAEGYRNVIVLRGGMQAWEAAALLEAFDEPQSEEALDEAAHIP
jgi:SulP family sulfate permease